MPSCKPELRVFESSSALFEGAARELASIAAAAVRVRGRFCIALSGGSTPRSLYALLASEKAASVPWEKTYFFFGDERDVPPEHADSNYRMASEAMLSKAPIPTENIFRVSTENRDAQTAALEYEQTLRAFFRVKSGEFPMFDLVLLGLGPDGHTASLFPGSRALNEQHRLFVANWVEKFKTYRLTLTFPVLNRAECDMFLVSGTDKAEILRQVLHDKEANLPSQRVCPESGRLLWFADSAAAQSLTA